MLRKWCRADLGSHVQKEQEVLCSQAEREVNRQFDKKVLLGWTPKVLDNEQEIYQGKQIRLEDNTQHQHKEHSIFNEQLHAFEKADFVFSVYGFLQNQLQALDFERSEDRNVLVLDISFI